MCCPQTKRRDGKQKVRPIAEEWLKKMEEKGTRCQKPSRYSELRWAGNTARRRPEGISTREKFQARIRQRAESARVRGADRGGSPCHRKRTARQQSIWRASFVRQAESSITWMCSSLHHAHPRFCRCHRQAHFFPFDSRRNRDSGIPHVMAGILWARCARNRRRAHSNRPGAWQSIRSGTKSRPGSFCLQRFPCSFSSSCPPSLWLRG